MTSLHSPPFHGAPAYSFLAPEGSFSSCHRGCPSRRSALARRRGPGTFGVVEESSPPAWGFSPQSRGGEGCLWGWPYHGGDSHCSLSCSASRRGGGQGHVARVRAERHRSSFAFLLLLLKARVQIPQLQGDDVSPAKTQLNLIESLIKKASAVTGCQATRGRGRKAVAGPCREGGPAATWQGPEATPRHTRGQRPHSRSADTGQHRQKTQIWGLF